MRGTGPPRPTKSALEKIRIEKLYLSDWIVVWVLEVMVQHWLQLLLVFAAQLVMVVGLKVDQDCKVDTMDSNWVVRKREYSIHDHMDMYLPAHNNLYYQRNLYREV